MMMMKKNFWKMNGEMKYNSVSDTHVSRLGNVEVTASNSLNTSTDIFILFLPVTQSACVYRVWCMNGRQD